MDYRTRMEPFNERITHLERNLDRLLRETAELSTSLQELKSMGAPPDKSPSETPPPLPPEPPSKPEADLIIPEVETPKTVPIPKKAPPKPKYNGGLELQLGRVWFVRLGIILLTTGLVFLSSYTYHNYVRDLAPGTRLGLFYLFAASLTGAGLFFESWKSSLKNYGRIVAAGGLATIYYCSFAAYHVEALKVINSPITASILLTLSAGLFCGVSLWKKSRLMLSTSLGLAFYSISINPNGAMVCVSSLILAAFGIVMMRRNNWMTTGFVVLVGSYLSFAWWQISLAQFSNDTQFFLLCYWALFVATSLKARQVGSEKSQILFSAINHSAFFLLFSLNLDTFTWIEHHWAFCLAMGIALVAIGLLGRKALPRNSIILHLTKGVGLITLGISLKLTGHILFLTLLIESLLLLAICFRNPHPLIRSGSQLVGLIALIFALDNLASSQEVPLAAWGIAVLLSLSYSIMDRLSRKEFDLSRLNPTSLFTGLLAFGFLTLASSDFSPEARCFLVALPGVFAPLVFLNTKARSMINDLLLVSVAISPVALLSLLDQNILVPWTYTIAAGIALAASTTHFFILNKVPNKNFHPPTLVLSGIHLAFATLFLVSGIILKEFPSESSMMMIFGVPIAGTLVSLKTKHPIHSSIPSLAYLGLFFVGSISDYALFIATSMTLAHLIILRKFHFLRDKKCLEAVTYLLTTLIFLAWSISAVSQPMILISWSAVGILLTDRLMPRRLTLFPASAFFLVAAIYFLLPIGNQSSSSAYLALLAPVALHLWRSSQNFSSKFNFLGVASLLALWIQVTRDSPLSSLSAVWAITGTLILLTGLLFRSRSFRLSALVILLASLGHVMLIDLIKLDPLPRILSFITLGLGLLALGFVYNRWQDRLKQIL